MDAWEESNGKKPKSKPPRLTPTSQKWTIGISEWEGSHLDHDDVRLALGIAVISKAKSSKKEGKSPVDGEDSIDPGKHFLVLTIPPFSFFTFFLYDTMALGE